MDPDENGQSAPSVALLLIVGEPFSEDHKTSILAEITKGFRCWDVEDTGVDINEELAQIANKASLGEEGTNGERFIGHQSENLTVEILINPVQQSVKNSLKKLLASASPVKYVIYAGHAFQDSGAWVLQDDTFTFSSFAQVFKDAEVENALKQNFEASLTIHTLADNNWGTCISKADFTNSLRIQLNPPEKLENIHGVLQFTAYVGSFVKVVPVTSLLQASEQFGNISFTQPTLYIFPGCQGDSALFGVNGFNLLVNGGYNRRACFWDFARHLDRVDAMLLTHLGTDNILSISSVLQRKSMDNIHPQIGYLYFNAPEKLKPLSAVNEEEEKESKNPSLLVNLAEEGARVAQMAKELGISPHNAMREGSGPNVEPINLYHKLGHGSLDMYALNPASDAKELKEFYQNWGKHAPSLGSSGPYPLQNSLSVCALLVWKPYNTADKIVRIFFPGNAPQYRVAEGFEKMKNYAFLKFPICTGKDLLKPPPKKAAGTTGRAGSGSSSSKTSARLSAPKTRVESPRKTEPKPAMTRSVTSPSKTTRTVKEDASKKNGKAKEEARPKTSPTRPSSSSSARSATSPRKAMSPTKATSPAKSPSPPKIGSPAKVASPKAKSPEVEKKPVDPKPAEKPSDEKVLTTTLESMNLVDIPAAVPEPVPSQEEKAEVPPPQEAWQENSSSMHDMAPPKKTESANFVSDSGDASHNFNLTNGSHVDFEDEEIKPQALPEPPVMVVTPCSDSLPDYSSKIDSDDHELSEFNQAEEASQHTDLTSSFDDPAQDIPSSPEPNPDEQDLHFSPPSHSHTSQSGFFSLENQDSSHPTIEQNIQYGVDHSSTRAMGGIKEEEEPEEEEKTGHLVTDSFLPPQSSEAFSDNLEQDDDDTTAFERDSDEDEVKHNVLAKQTEDCDDGKVGNVDVTRARGEVEEAGKGVDNPEKEASQHVEDGEQQLEPFEDGELKMSPREQADLMDSKSPDEDKDVDESFTPTPTANPSQPFQDQAGKGASFALSGHVAVQNGDGHFGVDTEVKGQEDGSFDPSAQWGHPMGLPSPPPPSKARSTTTDKRATSATSARADAKSRSATSAADSKRRPASASSKTASARPGTGTRRTGSSRSSPPSSKVPPLPPMTPFYVDLTYIPNHGDSTHCDAEFFKRIRARYYVLSSLSPNPKTLDSLMEAKETWDQPNLEVTLIPTYDNETIRHWMALNKEKLQELHIVMTPAVSRCTIQLQDLETSLPAYRLEV